MFAHKAVMSHANELGTKKIYLTITIIGALQQSAVTRSAPHFTTFDRDLSRSSFITTLHRHKLNRIEYYFG